MEEQLLKFWGSHSEAIVIIGYKALLAIVIFFVGLQVAKLLRKIIANSQKKHEKLDATLVPVLSSMVSYCVYAIAGVFILDIVGVNTSSLIALLGAAGLAIGLALKDTLSNIAAGVMLLILRPFRVGDYVAYGSVEGTICEINLFSTVLETFDGLYIASPNSAIWGNDIKNYTRNGRRRMDIIVPIAYENSIDEAFSVLQKLAAQEPRLLPQPAPQVMVASIKERTVNIQLRAWATVNDYWSVYWFLNKATKEHIEAAGLTIPYALPTLKVINASSSTGQ